MWKLDCLVGKYAEMIALSNELHITGHRPTIYAPYRAKVQSRRKNPPISTFKPQIAPILASVTLDRMVAKNAQFFVLSNTRDLTQLPAKVTAPQYDKVENGPKNAKFHPLNSKFRAF